MPVVGDLRAPCIRALLGYRSAFCGRRFSVRSTRGQLFLVFTQERYGYRMGIKPNLIEILTTIDGLSFDEAWTGHERVEVDGRQIPYISRAALLVNKRAGGPTQTPCRRGLVEKNRDKSE